MPPNQTRLTTRMIMTATTEINNMALEINNMAFKNFGENKNASPAEKAISRIQQAYNISQSFGNDLIVAYSGGKDSDVLLDLALKSGVPFKAEHNHTTIDAPPTVYHIREVFERLENKGISTKINYPEISMWGLIVNKGCPPTRIMRYCCEKLKERRFENQHLMFGVRWEESASRKNRGLHEKSNKNKDKRIIYSDENDDSRKLTEICRPKSKIVTNPIIDWTYKDIWNYARENKLKMNQLYEMGHNRVGCVGCPMASQNCRIRDFKMFPTYEKNYIRAFDRMLEKARAKGKVFRRWHNGKDVFKWWMDEKYNENQLSLFADEDD